jgi:hypothetical protein
MAIFWSWSANPAASLSMGILVFIVALFQGRHRGDDGKIEPTRVISAALQPPVLYTLLISVLGHFYLKIPISTTFSQGFGDERIAWLVLGLSLDIAIRLLSLFDMRPVKTP